MSKHRSHREAESLKAQTRFQQTLLDFFSQSKVRNPAYSLRSFAKRVGVGPAALSEMMSGKRRVSAKLASRILDNLNISPMDAQKITAAMERGRSDKSDPEHCPKVKILTNDQFRIVTEWYHFGILSVLELKDTSADVDFLSERLGVSKREVAAALERLERLGMLVREDNGQLKITGQQFHTADDMPSSAVRASHAQTLELAKSSLERDSVEIRDFTSLTFPANLDTIPKAKKLTRKFRTDLANLMGRDTAQEVYMLNVNLFPITKVNQKPNSEKEAKA